MLNELAELQMVIRQSNAKIDFLRDQNHQLLEALTDLVVVLNENGKVHDYLAPAVKASRDRALVLLDKIRGEQKNP